VPPGLRVGVTVNVFHAGLVYVLVGVFGAVRMGVGMLVLDVVVVVVGVCMRMGDVAVLVFVRVWRVVSVLVGHRYLLLV
jgi:hypothetical protein